ncbi:MAG: serine/threonine protein kinase, partial [Deltaproteobacteria bacterium]|nr:serine/threonine protein kinase [Deltaproteobacteria bacterium]
MERYCPRCFRRFESRVDKCPDDGSNLVVTEDRNLVGEELDGRYRVLERIGSGGMGVVYKAEQLLVKRIVALKVLRREVVREGSAVKRFLNEAQVIAALNNPHTVTLHDFGVTGDGLLYYTMELLRGRPLSRVIRQDGPLAVERATRLALQVCDSLEEAHERGILHRDLKPDNLFVQERKGLEELKVLDFGVAKLMGASGAKAVTGTGMIVGTPLYLSPEQALGDELGPSSDLYSLGIVLYEMLVGLPPFMGETPMQTILARLNKPVPPTAARNPSVRVPRRLEEFLSKALEKDPKRRFQTAAEFREALRTALDSGKQPVDAVLLPPLASSQGLTRVKTGEWEGPTSYADEAETTAQQSPASDPDAETHPASGASASRQALAPAVSPDEDKGQKSVSADSSEQSDSWGNGPGLEELGKKSVRRRLLLPVGAVLLLGLVGGFWHMYGPQSG